MSVPPGMSDTSGAPLSKVASWAKRAPGLTVATSPAAEVDAGEDDASTVWSAEADGGEVVAPVGG